VEVRKRLDIQNLLPISSAFAEVIEIPENVSVEHALNILSHCPIGIVAKPKWKEK
jgi:hypothetical protein